MKVFDFCFPEQTRLTEVSDSGIRLPKSMKPKTACPTASVGQKTVNFVFVFLGRLFPLSDSEIKLPKNMKPELNQFPESSKACAQRDGK